MDMMIIVDKLINDFSATDDALVYRARRIFHIMCVWLGCGIASVTIIISFTITNFHNNSNYRIYYYIFYEIISYISMKLIANYNYIVYQIFYYLIQ